MGRDGSPAKRYLLNEAVVKIGRDTECQICLESDPRVSRLHCEIVSNGGQKILRRLSLKNYMLLNGVEVAEALLKLGDIITVGDTEIRVSTNMAVPVSPSQVSKESLKQSPSMGEVVRLDLSQAKPKLPAPPGAPIRQQHIAPKSQSVIQGAPTGFYPAKNQALSSVGQRSQAKGARPPRPQSVLPKTGSAPVLLSGLLVAMIAVGVFIFLKQKPTTRTTPPPALRNTEEIIKDTEEIRLNLEALKEMQNKKEKNTEQFDIAQHHYSKGMRDYRQGNYQRAMASFQAALSFYPQHTLAIRYMQLSRRKLDNHIQFQMTEGRKSRERGQLKNCIAAFRKAQVLILDTKDSRFQEAQKYVDDCSFRLDGKY